MGTSRRITGLAGPLAAALIAISGCTAAPTNTPQLTAAPTAAPAATPTARECLYVYLQDVSSYSGPGTMAPQLQRVGDNLTSDATRLRDGTLPADDADFLAGFVAFLIETEAERAIEAEGHGASAVAAAFAEIARIMSHAAKAWPDDKALAADLIAEAANAYHSLGDWLTAC